MGDAVMDIRNVESDDYPEVLSRQRLLLSELSDAYSRNDHAERKKLTRNIGNLYAPGDEIAALMIAYAVEAAFRRAWYDSERNQISNGR